MSRKVILLACLVAALTLANPSSASISQMVDISTGVNVGALGNPLYSNGARDDYWRVRSVPGSSYGNSSIQSWVLSLGGGWNTIPGSMPIFGNNTNVGTSEYERCFCLQSVEKASLALTLRADNKANLFVNSYYNPVMSVLANNTFAGSVAAVTRTYTAQDGLKVGKNCIRVRVNNEGGPTGFALKATLQGFGAHDTAGEPCCRQGADVFTEALRGAATDLDPQPDKGATPTLELAPSRPTLDKRPNN